jgi:dTDP-glucose 4,6-dehydratase
MSQSGANEPSPRVIVTGGAGFIGSAVCRLLIDQTRCEVLNVDKLTYAANLHSLNSIAKNPRYHFAQADICDHGAIRTIFSDFKPSAVIHLAAETHVDRSIDNASEFIRTNVFGTETLLDTTLAYMSRLTDRQKEAFRFVMVSTDEVYGSLRAGDPAFSEETRYDPSSPYAASKAAADHLALAWCRTYALPVIISNCSNNFGPYQFPEKLIPLSILNAIERKAIRVYGQGNNIRDWLDVDDHARALLAILSHGRVGQKYNIGARNERSNLDVVRSLCQIMDELIPAGAPHSELIEFVADRPGHDFRYAIDPSKIEREIGWAATASFERSLRNTVEWYRENTAWWQPLRDKVYRGERIGTTVTRR